MVNGKSILVLTLSLFLILSGCRPRGVLHSWKMREVLVDLHKTDALLQLSGLQYGHDEAANIYYAMTLERHGVTQAQFDSSLVWYTAHPQLFDKIYPKVLKDLQQEREAFIAAHEEELRVRAVSRGELVSNRPAKKVRTFTKTQLDSVLWVSQHGYPTLWSPLPENLVHNSENQLLP